jgi:diphthamide synthase (EF-2-diphthine--ammonia ligase)
MDKKPTLEAEFAVQNSEEHRAAYAKMEALAERSRKRTAIAQSAGDTDSLLGTTSDALQILLYQMAMMAESLAKATSLQQMREAAEPFHLLTSFFVDQVASGDVKLTFQEKGVKPILRDVGVRSTAIYDVIVTKAEPAQGSPV